MSVVDDLLARYIADQEAGRPIDPEPLLDAAGDEREELRAALDRYLREAPRRHVEPAALAGSRAGSVAAGLERSLGGASGLWPSLLPRLRARAELRRADVVGRLAAGLGAQAQREKVGAYYHQMEQGLLPAEGVSDRVLEVLGLIFDEGVGRLREAGRSGAPALAPESPAAAAFARTDAAFEAPTGGIEEGAVPAGEAVPAGASDRWDEVDRLFRGRS